MSATMDHEREHGHDRHAGHSVAMFRDRFWIALILTIPVLIYSEEVARWVASDLGIDSYFAEVLPEYKAGKVESLQAGGAVAAMVGDGVNDAPALARANVGIAIGAGTDVARAAAGIVLVRNDPRDVVRVVALSRATYTKMVQNLAWAVGYNAVALPLAAGVLAGFGFVLPARNRSSLRCLTLAHNPESHEKIVCSSIALRRIVFVAMILVGTTLPPVCSSGGAPDQGASGQTNRGVRPRRFVLGSTMPTRGAASPQIRRQ
jgi:hypothetical protein